MTIGVLIVDDDPLVRAGLKLMLGGASGIAVLGERENGAEAVKAVRDHDVDVVLMDVRMPVLDGIEATREIVTDGVETKVIVLTTFDADEYVVRALSQGASGFLLKDTAPEQIIAAIRAVHAGEPALSPRITAQLIRQVAAGEHSPTDNRALQSLTERERDVAIAIGGGASNAEIASSLHMSLATVKAHISSIFTKLDSSNRVQVAIRVHDAGWL